MRVTRWDRLQRLKLLRETATAKRAGLGFALGAFIGIMPSFGIDSVMAFLLARRLNWGARAAAVGTLVMNPFTAPAFYWLGAQVGAGIMHRQMEWIGWQSVLAAPRDFALALLIGCTLVSFTSASLLGSGVYFWLRTRRAARAIAF
jgi:uncharacterized protein (DUF2062 family)